MNNASIPLVAGLTLSLFLVRPAWATPPSAPLDPTKSIEYAAEHNPTLAAAILDARQAEQSVIAEDGRFVPVFQADATATHAKTPRLQSGGGISAFTSDSFILGAQLSHTFRWGTQFTARLQGTETTSTSQLQANATIPTVATSGSPLLTLGPSYGLTGRLSVTQPLLRGAGRRNVESALRQARLAGTAANRARDLAASALLRDILSAYWELWYQDRAVEIDERARNTAVVQRNQSQQRVDAGALSSADILTFETRVAQLDQALATSRAQRRRQSLDLSRQLGTELPTSELQTDPTTPQEGLPDLLNPESALNAALQNSVEIAQLEVQLEQARERGRVAGEASRPRLDLQGYVQGDGLAYKDVPGAFEYLARGKAISANIGLTLELPVTSTTRTALRKAADLATEATDARLQAMKQQIQAQIATQFSQFDAARERLTLADRTVEVAARQVAAQTERYSRGAAIAFEVQQAEDALRQAQLTGARALVDRVQAGIQLQHLTGNLLRRNAPLYDRRIRSSRPATPNEGATGFISTGTF